MKIAVTGASGHVGNVLCRRLLECGYQVRALVHEDFSSIEDLKMEKIQGDILHFDSMVDFCRGMDVVFHLAAKISIDGDPDGSLMRVNVEGTRNVANACLATAVKRLIHFSSIHACEQKPLKEELNEQCSFVSQTASPYNLSKALGEKSVQTAVKQGLDAVIIIPTGILGPFDYKPSFMGQALLDLYHGKIPSLVKGGFDWVDVRDVVDFSICAIEKGRRGERYFLSGNWKTIRDVMEIFAKITGKKAPRWTTPNWLAKSALPLIKLYSKWTKKPPLYTKESLDTLLYSNSNITARKAKKELGYRARPLEETLHDTFTWFKERGVLS